LTNQKEAYSY